MLLYSHLLWVVNNVWHINWTWHTRQKNTGWPQKSKPLSRIIIRSY